MGIKTSRRIYRLFLVSVLDDKTSVAKETSEIIGYPLLSGILFTVGVSYFQAMENREKIVGDFYDYRAPGIVLVTATLFSMI